MPILYSTLITKNWKTKSTLFIKVLIVFLFALSYNNAISQTILLHPDTDGGFDNGETFTENNWRWTESPTNNTRNQWVCNTGATPGFSGRRSAYVSNNRDIRTPAPPHKYTASPARASHIYRDITVPAGETEITVDFIWIGVGEGSVDRMRIWVVPNTYQPTYGTEITAAADRIQIGGNYSGSSTWIASPTLLIPPAYAGTIFRFVVEWANNNSLEFDPPAGIDDISMISSTPPPPPNDEPCTAINLPVNATCTYAFFTNYGATFSAYGGTGPYCANYISGDVWFTTTVPASGGLIIDTQIGEMTDGGMAIYRGTCGALSFIECDDNDSANGLMPYILRTDLIPGETIYIRIWESGYDNNGSFGICVTPSPPSPPNDECVNAVGLTVNPSLTCTIVTPGSTAYATASPQPDDVEGTPDNDVWFYFVATNTNHLISLLDIVTVVGTNDNLAVGVYNSPGGNCSSLIFETTSNPEIFNVIGLNVGDTYYVRVYGRGVGANSAQVNFNICISTPPPPPPNNFCTNAIALQISPVCSYDIFTNAGASDSGIPDPGCGNYLGGDVWFYVVVDDTGEITVDTQEFVMNNGAMALYTGNDCNNLTLLECDNDGSANGLMPSITRTGLTPGQVVYIRIWERGNNNNGTFGICVTSPAPEGVTEVNLGCPGDSSESLYAIYSCTGSTSLGNVLSGILNPSTDSVALQPTIFITSNDPCSFDPVTTANYNRINFTVNTTGTYVFSMASPSPYFDAMGYIVVNNGNFIPGSCNTGTWIAGDDDDGPSLNPLITANLVAGTPYSLITTKFAFESTTHTGPFTWNVSGPPADVEWYANQTGGSPIGTGYEFNPVGVPGSGIPDTNSPGVYTFWVNCPASSSPRTPTEFTIGKIWRGSVSSDWNDLNNWKPKGKPTSTDCVYIDNVANPPILNYPGLPTPPNPGYAKNLSIGNNASLELSAGTSLTVSDWIDIDNLGSLLIRNNANLVQITDVATNNNTGRINMQRAVAGVTSLDYIYWSSPVEDFNVTNISPGSNLNRIYKWIPTVSGNGAGNYGEWQFTNETMQTGIGYIIRGLSGTTPTPPVTITTTEFIGTPNNGIINVPVQRGTYSGANYPGAGSTMATALDDNWNLIGNPYPSSISAREFITVNASSIIDDISPAIAGTIYLWRHLSAPSNTVGDPFYGDFGYNYNPNDYIKFNHTGSAPAGFDGYIAAGQSFFVLMDHNTSSASESVIFNNTMRNETFRNDQFYRTENEPEHHRIWLDLINANNLATSILVGYIEGATNNLDLLFDGYDLSDSSTKFYSIIDEDKMAIQGKALPFNENDTVPLGIEIPQVGTYTIGINTLDGLFESSTQDIYLEDTYVNTIHDLRMTPYIFTSESGIFNDRFILRYTNTTLGIEEVALNSNLDIYAPNGQYVKIKSNNALIDTVLIYDLLGRELINETKINTTEHTMRLSNLSDGIYLVKATLNNGKQKTQKVVLKQ